MLTVPPYIENTELEKALLALKPLQEERQKELARLEARGLRKQLGREAQGLQKQLIPFFEQVLSISRKEIEKLEPKELRAISALLFAKAQKTCRKLFIGMGGTFLSWIINIACFSFFLGFELNRSPFFLFMFGITIAGFFASLVLASCYCSCFEFVHAYRRCLQLGGPDVLLETLSQQKT